LPTSGNTRFGCIFFDVLVRRFSETRRPHPLSSGKPILDMIRLERKRLTKIRELADETIDTSEYTVHRVKELVIDRFRALPSSARVTVHLVSFGYKHGVPLESDLLFDVRFLPNPYFVAGMKALSGRDAIVAKYLRSFPETREFIKRLRDFLKYMIPFYLREGKSYLTIAVGCTGGRHRSVFVVEELAKVLKVRKVTFSVRHRDEKR
jgi:UPF0042 nucleotide-binding protein